MKNLIAKITLLILLSGSFYHPLTAQNSEPDFRKLDEYLNLLYTNNKMMGSVSISKDGNAIYQKQIGFTDQNKQIKVDTETKFRIGSISKMFTAVMAFQLIEEHKIRLETKISDYFPNIPNSEKITISNLLNHRSGIYNFTNDPLYLSYMTGPKTRSEMLEIVSGYESQFEPDSSASYSNSNFLLLSYIIEDVTGNSYKEELEKRIIKKTGLDHTSYGGKINSDNKDAYSYTWNGSKWELAPETDMSIPVGAGAIVSTTSDLNEFIHALFTGKFISDESLTLMQSFEDGYGRGMFNYPFGKRSLFGHNGGIDGFVSHLSFYPQENLSVSITCNALNYDLNNIIIGVLSAYFNTPFEIPNFNLKPITLKKSEIKKLVGNFSSETLPLDISISTEDEKLIAQAAGQSSFPITPYENGIFKYETAGIKISYPTKNNKIIDYDSFVMKQGGREYKYSRIKE